VSRGLAAVSRGLAAARSGMLGATARLLGQLPGRLLTANSLPLAATRPLLGQQLSTGARACGARHEPEARLHAGRNQILPRPPPSEQIRDARHRRA
jgi:hypothetical protein